jgi:RNA polymerase sigma-70 factor (ECF subfamily)
VTVAIFALSVLESRVSRKTVFSHDSMPAGGSIVTDRVPTAGSAVSSGDAGAGELFYQEFLAPLETRMKRSIWRIVRDPELARDTLQDALAVLWKRRDIVRAHPNPEALVLRVCVNSACDSLRRLQRRRRLESTEEAAPELPDRQGGPWAGLLEAEIRRAVTRLPANQATALLLRAIEGQPYPAIAAALGCSAITARGHVMRARFQLRRLLADLAPSGRRARGET